MGAHLSGGEENATVQRQQKRGEIKSLVHDLGPSEEGPKHFRSTELGRVAREKAKQGRPDCTGQLH